ncbi:unnamed protein product, partial [Prunus brigantina]
QKQEEREKNDQKFICFTSKLDVSSQCNNRIERFKVGKRSISDDLQLPSSADISKPEKLKSTEFSISFSHTSIPISSSNIYQKKNQAQSFLFLFFSFFLSLSLSFHYNIYYCT